MAIIEKQKTEKVQPENIIGEVSEIDIQKWKEENPQGIKEITCQDDDGNFHIGYLKKPTLDILSAASQHLPADPLKSGKIMFNSCFLGGSDFIKNDDEARAGVQSVLKKLFKVREFEVKKI